MGSEIILDTNGLIAGIRFDEQTYMKVKQAADSCGETMEEFIVKAVELKAKRILLPDIPYQPASPANSTKWVAATCPVCYKIYSTTSGAEQCCTHLKARNGKPVHYCTTCGKGYWSEDYAKYCCTTVEIPGA